MEVQDRRVRRTQHLLAEALIALTLEKGYEAVTIRDITERADIGYATFFRHYRDKDELLKDVLDVVLNELNELLCTPLPAADPTTTGVLLFRYVQEHEEVVRVLLKSHTLRQNSIQAATLSTISKTMPQPDSIVPPEIAAHHIVASTMTLIEWWLDHQMPYPAERMGMIYAELIARPTSAVALLPK
jgi:AcrR family transcriptional regulator